MRSYLWVACALLGVLTAACNPLLDRQYYREGIGTDLHWDGLPEASRLHRQYVGLICEQAGIPFQLQDGTAVCEQEALQAVHWPLFVQAGMNDIDLRCDSYLAWLDDKRRTSQPILKQINDMSVVTQSIMRLTGYGADPITIVGLAFGLAADTFTNVRSRLLLEVNHSTVQTVVLGRQREYRAVLFKQRVDNRPAAIHALRSYLRLCMPFTIEMEINNTVVVFERAGPGALREPPLITPETIRPSLISDPSRPLPDPIPPRIVTVNRLTEIEQKLPSSFIKELQLALCVNVDGDLGKRQSKTRQAISAYLKAQEQRPSDVIDNENQGELSKAIIQVKDCKGQNFRNAFEVGTFGVVRQANIRTIRIKEVQAKLGVTESGVFDPQTRTAIAEKRDPGRRELGDHLDEAFYLSLFQ